MMFAIKMCTGILLIGLLIMHCLIFGTGINNVHERKRKEIAREINSECKIVVTEIYFCVPVTCITICVVNISCVRDHWCACKRERKLVWLII
jgi:hypothetical protein